jgi:hypothetical protein
MTLMIIFNRSVARLRGAGSFRWIAHSESAIRKLRLEISASRHSTADIAVRSQHVRGCFRAVILEESLPPCRSQIGSRMNGVARDASDEKCSLRRMGDIDREVGIVVCD